MALVMHNNTNKNENKKKIDKSYLYFLHADATGVVDFNTHRGDVEKILIHTTTEGQQKNQC